MALPGLGEADAAVGGLADDAFLDGVDEELGAAAGTRLFAGSDATAGDFVKSIEADSDELASEPMSCFNSFTPDTPVLLADGTTEPIKDVKVGDGVEATDPTSGKTRSEPVTQLHDNQDTDLTDLLVQTPTGLAIIHTTQKHPFWNQTAKHWTPASALTPQTVLQTDDETLVTVIYASNWSGSQDMRNLTVAQIHTYYVVAGFTPVLVHNEGGDPGPIYYRGVMPGDSLSFGARPGVDFDVDPNTGFVVPGRGVSLTTNPDSLGKYGRVGVPVDTASLPSDLEIVQVGRPGHYEIAVKPGANLTADEFQSQLGQIGPAAGAGCP